MSMAGKHEAPQSGKAGRKHQRSRAEILILCLTLLLIAAIGVIIWQAVGKEDKNQQPQGEAQTAQSENGGLVVPERPEMLDVTAYETIKLKADTLEQSVRFENPLQNNCWLVITLSLEDGTILWKSEELIPGQVVRSITMNRTLEAGEYENAVLRYQHWTFDDAKEALNGAETLVTLNVQ